MPPELTYREPQPISEKEVFDAIRQDDVERLVLIPIELGFHHDDWRFIQDISIRLSDHADPRVRRNSLFGIEYAARFKGRVEKNVVKPVLLRALNDPDAEVSYMARETIDAVNHLMGWNIGGAARQKELERRFESRRQSQSGEQGGSGQPATRSESDLKSGDKPQPESEGRSR